MKTTYIIAVDIPKAKADFFLMLLLVFLKWNSLLLHVTLEAFPWDRGMYNCNIPAGLFRKGKMNRSLSWKYPRFPKCRCSVHFELFIKETISSLLKCYLKVLTSLNWQTVGCLFPNSDHWKSQEDLVSVYSSNHWNKTYILCNTGFSRENF